MPVKPAPATPSPAATLVLLRDRPAGGIEILMMQRHRSSRFAAGDFVFPGGKIEPDDTPPDAAAWCAGLDGARAAAVLRLDDPHAALAAWIGAIRETFEEVGVLLACDAGGAPVRPDAERFVAYRRACAADHRAFWRMVREEALTLATDRLVYFAHWITPVDQPLRFDTRFFAAPMPPGQTPRGDDHEVIDVRWLAPDEALALAHRGEISLRNPTARNLALFAGAPSTAAALAALGDRPVTTIVPRVVVDGATRRILLPGDPGYDTAPS